jgi:hypothetical protein
VQTLKDAGGSHTPAHAHGDDAVLEITGFEGVQQRGGKLGPRAAKRMAERNRSTVDVDFRRV